MFYCWQAHFPPTDSKTVWLEELVFNFEDMLLLSRRFLLNSMDKKKKKKKKLERKISLSSLEFFEEIIKILSRKAMETGTSQRQLKVDHDGGCRSQ